MTRVILLAVLVVVTGCKGSSESKGVPDKEGRCAKTRDEAIPILEANVKEALTMGDASEVAKMKAQGEKEIAQFKARFVDICKSADDATIKCLEASLKDRRSADAKACKDLSRPVWHKIYTEP